MPQFSDNAIDGIFADDAAILILLNQLVS